MTSPVDFCSNALLMLGAKPIASFDEAAAPANLDRARLCANLYPMVKADVLRSHPWHCAIKRVQLSPDAEAPAFGYAYRYLQPGDWLRTLGVGEERCPIPYVTEGRYYLCNEALFPLVYLADIPETQFDSMLAAVMTLSMAVRLAYPITASSTVEDARYRELQQLLKQARAVNAQDDPPQELGGSPLLSSRFGSTWIGAGR